MKLITGKTNDQGSFAGVLQEDNVLALPYPTLLELLRDPAGMEVAQQAVAGTHQGVLVYPLHTVALLAPIPEPPTLRDFYAFEQHVKTARAKRGLEMVPAWYEFPTFYFSNTSEIAGPDA